MTSAIIKNLDFQIVAQGLTPDSKKRLSLSKAQIDEKLTYNVYVNTLGQIILDPQKSIPAYEAWIFEDKDILASIKRGLQQMAQGKTKDLGSFAKYAE